MVFELIQVSHNNELKYFTRYTRRSLFSLHWTVQSGGLCANSPHTAFADSDACAQRASSCLTLFQISHCTHQLCTWKWTAFFITAVTHWLVPEADTEIIVQEQYTEELLKLTTQIQKFALKTLKARVQVSLLIMYSWGRSAHSFKHLLQMTARIGVWSHPACTLLWQWPWHQRHSCPLPPPCFNFLSLRKTALQLKK